MQKNYGRSEAISTTLISARQLGNILGLSMRHVFRLGSMGKIPASKRIGRSVRWSAKEIDQWIEAGTPERVEWEKIKQD